MEAQLEILPEPAKKLADYPMISENYRRSTTAYLIIDKVEFEQRSASPKTAFDRKFAPLHLEAIKAELATRNRENTY